MTWILIKKIFSKRTIRNQYSENINQICANSYNVRIGEYIRICFVVDVLLAFILMSGHHYAEFDKTRTIHYCVAASNNGADKTGTTLQIGAQLCPTSDTNRICLLEYYILSMNRKAGYNIFTWNCSRNSHKTRKQYRKTPMCTPYMHTYTLIHR